MAMPAIDVRPARKGPLRLDPIPEILRPLIRAYLLGYASAVAPRLLTLVLQHVAKRKRKLASQLAPDLDDSSFVSSAVYIEPLKSILEKTARGLSEAGRLRLARWLSTFLAAWFGLRLLHSYEGRAYTETVPPKEGSAHNTEPQTVKFAGRTMDLTLFAVTRALDVLVGDLWARHKARRLASNRWSKAERFLSKFVDPLVFAASSGLVMWAWFYHPSRLPRSYNKWITSAASVDLRLIEALRRCHSGEFQYGKETGQAHLLQESRRKDIALFVAPRALATVLPRRYSLDKEWRERLVFAASTAVVFTCVAENPDRVRGVFGKLLKMVLNK
uniref:Uncharacterized protein n=1 Tax=Fusarium oxysporum (strain Fo5176) TaxID=660025 RepID=A0A0D2XVK0_FUSOF